MTTPLIKLSTAAIKSLAEAIRCGRLSSPYSDISLRDYAPVTDSSEIASELQRLSKSGVDSANMVYVLDAIAAERARNQPVEDMVELVWTGPKSIQSATRDTGVVVREMFTNADEDVLIAAYAVYQGKRIFKELADRMDALPRLRVRMFLNITRAYQDQRSEAELLREFAELFRRNDWPGQRQPEVFYDPRALTSETGGRAALHAKCVVVDGSAAFVTSANFTEAAQDRNIEAGVFVRIPSFAAALVGQFDNLISYGHIRRVPSI
jgi:phosphatidylserine/phosphatidylglycerophosphate/cardiolipin synthase-like enzyme